VRAERRDYDGPISLTLAGLDERFVVTNAVIPARTNLTKLRVTARADTALGDALDFSILGKASINGTEVSTRASTMPALHSVFPELRYPPRELDGLLTVTIAGTSSSTPASATKKKKK